MSQKTIAGITVEVNEEGYLLDYTKWTKEMGEELAKSVEIELTDFHWKVINHLRSEYENSQTTPTIRTLNKSGIAPTKELYRAFPNGPLKKATFIAGIPKPASCI